MRYVAQNFDHLLGTKGFSDKLLKNHFALYQGYVANTNKLAGALTEMVNEDQFATSEYAELKRSLVGNSMACGCMNITSAI